MSLSPRSSWKSYVLSFFQLPPKSCVRPSRVGDQGQDVRSGESGGVRAARHVAPLDGSRIRLIRHRAHGQGEEETGINSVIHLLVVDVAYILIWDHARWLSPK